MGPQPGATPAPRRAAPGATRQRIRTALAWGGAALALAGVGFGLAVSQARAEEQLNQTFQTRADIARQFVASYVDDVLSREQAVGGEQLGGESIDDAQFRAIVQSFGFTAAVLLDDHGRALDVFPAAPGKIGTNLAVRYAHLARAEQGIPTVSHVVLSASLNRPVVAFASPFSTAHGRRVLSGAFDVNATPVANYLHNSLPQVGARAYLVDKTSGVVVADEAGATPNAAPLSIQAPQLAAAVSTGPDGSFQDSAGARYFVQRDVLNSPWRVVMSVPDETLYRALAGPAKWAPWGLFALLVAGTALLGRMLGRLQQSRRALVAANRDLVLLARIDKLTGLYNRRHMEEQIDILLHTAVRAASPASLLMLDVDHFKSINDLHGHAMGDRALQALGEAIRVSLRPGDVCGRWGGEEFVVLLPNTDAVAAVAIGERLRQSAAEMPFASAADGPLPLTISVGVAASVATDVPKTLVERADAALYRVKAAGRNAVAA